MKKIITAVVLILVIALVVAGYFIYRNNNETHYLTITQWQVKITLSKPIDGATYVYNPDTNLGQAVFLSTSNLQASKACQQYYNETNIPAAYARPSFQWIRRFSLDQSTSLYEGGAMMSAQQAAAESPGTFIRVGNYVYTFGHGNGDPCSEQPADLVGAFNEAFLTITASPK